MLSSVQRFFFFSFTRVYNVLSFCFYIFFKYLITYKKLISLSTFFSFFLVHPRITHPVAKGDSDTDTIHNDTVSDPSQQFDCYTSTLNLNIEYVCVSVCVSVCECICEYVCGCVCVSFLFKST